MKVLNKPLNDEYVLATYKIDGVRGIKTKDGWLSRAGKPLYNLPEMPDGEYEIFLGDFKRSISACRTHIGDPIPTHCLYQLTPDVDKRLIVGDVKPSELDSLFKTSKQQGYEGLVIHTSTGLYKIKDILTFDCVVKDIQPGTGKNLNKMGALIIELNSIQFKVGTGFTDIQRKEFNSNDIIGQIIEVQAMEMLPSGKLRHPRFIRLREDLK